VQIGRAEVAYLDVRATDHHDVRRLEVAMHDSLPRRVVERAAAFERDLGRVFDRKQAFRRRERGKVSAGHVLDCDISAGLVVDRGLQNRRDVRMRQPSGERGFVQELLGARLVEHGLRVENLERDLLLGKGIERKVNRA
jgi:hypothetical protein